MARLDWFAFLRQHNIPYTTTGPNASRGRVNVRCPFCGEADPSEHMGISISGNGWSCWRNQSHRGRDTPRLVAALLKCGLAEAERLAGGTVMLPADEDLQSHVRTKLGEGLTPSPVRIVPLKLPPEFYPLNNGSRFADQFLAYMRFRGYKSTSLDWLIDAYNLRYCTAGPFAYRVIIPIYDRWYKLQTWTGRSILQDEELRYKTLRQNQHLCSPKETLLGLPLLWAVMNPKALVICEGPFDAFWITALGRAFGVYATCLFGLTLQPSQADLLMELRQRFPRQTVLLDTEARFQTFRLANSGLDLGVAKLPVTVKDPAELPLDDLINLCVELGS